MRHKSTVKLPDKKAKSTPSVAKNWRDFLFPIAVGGVVALGVVAGLIPQLKDIFAIRAEIADLTKELEVLDQKYGVLTAYSDADLNRMVYMVEGALPSDKPIFQAVTMMQNMAAERGLVVSDFDFSPGSVATDSANETKSTKNANGLQSMAIQTSLVGTFGNLLAFVEAMENSLPLSEVEGFSVSSGASSSEEIKTTMTVNIFYMAPPTSIGKVTSPLKPLTVDQVAALESLSNYAYTNPTTTLAPVGQSLRENPFVY